MITTFPPIHQQVKPKYSTVPAEQIEPHPSIKRNAWMNSCFTSPQSEGRSLPSNIDIDFLIFVHCPSMIASSHVSPRTNKTYKQDNIIDIQRNEDPSLMFPLSHVLTFHITLSSFITANNRIKGGPLKIKLIKRKTDGFEMLQKIIVHFRWIHSEFTNSTQFWSNFWKKRKPPAFHTCGHKFVESWLTFYIHSYNKLVFVFFANLLFGFL